MSTWSAVVATKSATTAANRAGSSTCGKCPAPAKTSSRLPGS
ncbi:hypothetical protein ACFQX8_13555 [Klenkia terrae]